MKLPSLVATVATLAALSLPAQAGDQGPPASLTASPAVSGQSVEAPPTSADLLGALFADGGGLPCTQMCFISKDCPGCDPPVTLSCSGCQSCTQGGQWGIQWIQCDGVRQYCTCPL